MTEIILELTCAVVLGITLAYLWLAARKKDIRRQKGWWYIVAGFSLLFFGMLLDITDNFPALEKYIIIGNTPVQVILEKVIGYLFGFLLLAIGFIKWLPTVIALNQTRKRREVELVRLSSALAGLAEMVIITGLDHRIIYANPATKNVLGYSPEEVIGRPASEFFEGFPGNPPNLAEKMRDEAVDGTWQGELLNRRKDGSFIHVHLTMSLLKDEDGTLVGYVGITRDITERHRAEEAIERAYHELKGLKSRLIQAEKLSAIGRLAAGVAHELNSPLDGIMTLLRLSRRRVVEGSREHEQAIAMLTAAEHMAGIIQDLTSFARETKGVLERVNLNEVIESTLSFSAYQFTERNITIIKDFSDSLPEIRGDKGHLQQVVLNLIINARDAMSGGGTLRIRTGSSGDNEKVLMEFADTGSGIAKENLDKIFDPFFTTKQTGEGIGLGLSVSYGIIEYHKGEITVASKPGEGTIFTVTIPVGRGDRDG